MVSNLADLQGRDILRVLSEEEHWMKRREVTWSGKWHHLNVFTEKSSRRSPGVREAGSQS